MRKARAECFTAVSYNTSAEVRRTQLSPLFIRLVSNPCQWVRQAAFQSLGPFISTFANPSRAGLYIREDDSLSIQPPSQDGEADFASGSPKPASGDTISSTSSMKPGHREPHLMEGTSAETSVSLTENRPEGPALARPGLTRHSPRDGAFLKLSDAGDLPSNSRSGPDPWAYPSASEDMFSSVLYWRTPLPDISKDVELLLIEARLQEEVGSSLETTYNSCVARSKIQKVLENVQEHMMNDPDVQAQVGALSAALRVAQLDSDGEAECKPVEGLDGVSASAPRPAPCHQPTPASPQNVLCSVTRDSTEHRMPLTSKKSSCRGS